MVSKPAAIPIPHLLTPEEGCGYSKVPQKRIMGGAIAKDGNTLYFLKRNAAIRNIFIDSFKKNQN